MRNLLTILIIALFSNCAPETECDCIPQSETDDLLQWKASLIKLYEISDTNKVKAVLLADKLIKLYSSNSPDEGYPIHQKIEELHYFKAEIFYNNNLPNLSLIEINQSGDFNEQSKVCILSKIRNKANVCFFKTGKPDMDFAKFKSINGL